MSLEYCDMGAASLDANGVLLVQCKGAAVDAAGTAAPDFGRVPVMCALGLTAMQYPSDAKGSAECLVATGVGGLDGVVIAACDTRTASIVGALKPGDTVLHSTGPQQAAQVQLKEEKRQAVVRTVDTRGKDAVLIIDGLADKLTIAAFGHVLEMSRDNGIALTEKGGASLILKDGRAALIGAQVTLGGPNAVAPLVGCVPPAVPAGPATQGVPTPGIFYGS